MTNDDIFHMAETHGWLDDFGRWNFTDDGLLDFAFEIQKAEREACAKVCDAESQRARWNWENDILKNQTFWNGGEQLASSCAEAIRARSNHD